MHFSNPLLTLLIAATTCTQLASCKPAPIVGGRPSRGWSGPNPDQAATPLQVMEAFPLNGPEDARIVPGSSPEPSGDRLVPGISPESSGSSQGSTSGTNGFNSGAAAASFALAQAEEGGHPSAFSAAFSNGGQSPSAASFSFSGLPVEFFGGGGSNFFNVAFG